MKTRRSFLSESVWGAAGLVAARPLQAFGAPEGAADPKLLERALGLLDRAPLIDTHNDLPTMLIELSAGDLTRFDLGVRQPMLCADVPALRAGHVGVQYWSVFVESSTQRTHVSLHEALREFDVALRLIRSQPAFEQAHSAAALRIFHELGARYLTLTHWDNIDWADAATDRPEHFGLTELGRKLVRELNRLGMFVDLSHVSADTMREALHVSTAPVLFSHSDAFAINPHPRNVPDDVLRAVRDNGGVVHVNFIRPFVSPDGAAWGSRRDAALRDAKARTSEQSVLDKAMADWDAASGQPRAGIADVADHIDHIRKVAGIDHIGIGADFYKAEDTDMATGLGDATRYPWLFAELLRRGYSDDEVLKIAGRNHLRAMRQMEQVAAGLRRTEAPLITEGPKTP